MKFPTMTVLFLCTTTSLASNDYHGVVHSAFETNKQVSGNQLAFTETYTSEGVTYVSRFDPRPGDGQQWTLTAIDGKPPTSREFEKFTLAKVEAGSPNARDETPGLEFVEMDSLQLIDETSAIYQFSFRPDPDEDNEDAALMRYAMGILSIDKAANYVRSMRLMSEQSFKPAPGVKVTSLDVLMDFGPAASCDQIVLLSVSAHVKGRAYYMFDFDEVEETVYSDFECFSLTLD